MVNDGHELSSGTALEIPAIFNVLRSLLPCMLLLVCYFAKIMQIQVANPSRDTEIPRDCCTRLDWPKSDIVGMDMPGWYKKF
jgi:hypothetical protein